MAHPHTSVSTKRYLERVPVRQLLQAAAGQFQHVSTLSNVGTLRRVPITQVLEHAVHSFHAWRWFALVASAMEGVKQESQALQPRLKMT